MNGRELLKKVFLLKYFIERLPSRTQVKYMDEVQRKILTFDLTQQGNLSGFVLKKLVESWSFVIFWWCK